MATHRPVSGVVCRDGRFATSTRELAEEMAVALSYNGSTQAVMMATPADLDDFATGFSITEGFATREEIVSVEAVRAVRGIDLRIWLAEKAGRRLNERRRSMAGPVGCGLCGIDSLEEAMRPPPPVTVRLAPVAAGEIREAMAAISAHQPLHDATRSAHAAGFWLPGQGMLAVREDVGRHNALDKLVGGLVRKGIAPASGIMLITSRASVDLVQKTAMAGCGVLVAASAPTAAAVETAEGAGICLVGLGRTDGFEIFSRPERIHSRKDANVA
ncbi:formate dehydrogenase accessory sulfurtransferase FdhD [Stappia sp. MMSF_3263]|uniref:formate dehydrogenase accessory sulfurtransferase FdhD n=1 Tax=Stappia sp. MMSF_3263 TaxID=3046693 RepID=UPI00273D93ED|nr:formate dehydrogenase accessory sulfurtransferase FdhD [Stappia sp. MMSF_3263]